MATNFNIYPPSHNATLSFRHNNEAFIDDTLSLADASSMRTISLATDVFAFEWKITFDSPQVLRFIFIPYISPDWDDVTITLLRSRDGEVADDYVKNGVRVGNVGYIDVSDVSASDDLSVIVDVGTQSLNSMTMAPPFFCNDGLAQLTDRGYLDGRSYENAGQVQYQQTKTQRYADVSANFPEKTIDIDRVSEIDAAKLHSFSSKNNGRLVLLTECNPASDHDYTLGFLTSNGSSRNYKDNNTFRFTISSKFAEAN